MPSITSFGPTISARARASSSGCALRAFPPADVRETDDEVIVTAEIPGLEEKDFELSLTAEALTIRGEKRREHEEKGSVHRFERSYGAFERTLPLPCEATPGPRGVASLRAPERSRKTRSSFGRCESG
jgi:HSP20 family molecular chaperone IbpA